MCFNERPIKGYTSAAIDYQFWCFLFNLQQVEISRTVRAGVFGEDACVYAPLPSEVTPTHRHTHTKQACCSTDGKDHCSLRQRAAQQPAGVVSERQLANQVCSLSCLPKADRLSSRSFRESFPWNFTPRFSDVMHICPWWDGMKPPRWRRLPKCGCWLTPTATLDPFLAQRDNHLFQKMTSVGHFDSGGDWIAAMRGVCQEK